LDSVATKGKKKGLTPFLSFSSSQLGQGKVNAGQGKQRGGKRATDKL